MFIQWKYSNCFTFYFKRFSSHVLKSLGEKIQNGSSNPFNKYCLPGTFQPALLGICDMSVNGQKKNLRPHGEKVA